MSCPATSYVAAMFHPTIGQCACQSLSTTATPELGMIPTRSKGTLAGSHIAKDISKFSQAKTSFGFIRLQRRWKAWTAKLVSLTTELWTPAPNLDWLLKHLHIQQKGASPSLQQSPLGYAFLSSVIQGVQGRKPTPLDLSVRFLPTLGLSSQFRANSTPNQFKPRKKMHTQQDTNFWVEEKRFATKNTLLKWGKTTQNEQFEFSNDYGHCMSQIDCYKVQNRNSLLSIHSITQKQISWACTMRKRQQIVNERVQYWVLPNNFPAMGRNEEIWPQREGKHTR